ncbi:MAG: putative glycoside hydrolase family 15 protein, partial [Candidatus Thermoplasmatota archaeon]|nr:putative glycoside hydrolase family 15 protein [Candidatus Thermoplasmatota archaeon]
MARWDTVIIGLEIQYNSPNALMELKRLNPDIIILAYVLSQEVPDAQQDITDVNHPHYKLLQEFQNRWWLKDSSGDPVIFWPGTQMVNVTPTGNWANNERWYKYLPKFMHDNVMSTGYWDGIFYDNMWNDISWLNNGDIDLNQDGTAESRAVLDDAWREGMNELLSQSRQLEGEDAIIIGNGGGQYFTHVNGRFIEEFPSVLDGGWAGAMQKYYSAIQQSFLPSLVIINSSTSTGSADDYQKMRYT